MEFEKFVSIDLSEDEYDQIIEWLSEQEISTGLGKLYDRLIEAVENRDLESEDEDSDE